MQKSFLGRGWRFPFGFDQTGITMSEYEQNIRESITLILGTKPGERQMLPDFGCRIHELMFTPNSTSTATIVAHHVQASLARWEPRIEVTKVDSWPDPGGTVRVAVHYKIRSTQQAQDLSVLLGA